MSHSTDHNDVDTALQGCGSTLSAAQAHGLLCGRLAVCGTDGVTAWRKQVLENPASVSVLRADCEALLDEMLTSTWQQLAERQSELELLLPADDEDAASRTQALADWCEGFLHGLVTGNQDEAVRRRLAAEPLDEVIQDLLQISRATLGDDDEETNELAYAELVEYIRVAAQLAYEELADLRQASEPPVAGS